MKCKQCGTTIPEGNKKCNGCGKKITIFSNSQNSQNTTNNYKIIDDYPKINKKIEQKKVEISQLLEDTNININQTQIQDKNAITAMILSIFGMMFIPFGIILNIIALIKAKQIENPDEKQKTLKIVRIVLAISATLLLFTLLPIILSI